MSAVLRRPVQVWLPLIGEAEATTFGTLRSAFGEYRGEWAVWVLPDLDEPRRYIRDGWWELAVPGQRLDRIDVFHIGTNGFIFGEPARVTERFGSERQIDGFLDAWLGAAPEFASTETDISVIVERPYFGSADTPHYRTETIVVRSEPAEARRRRWGERLAALIGFGSNDRDEWEEHDHMQRLAKEGGDEPQLALFDASVSPFPFVHDSVAFSRDAWFAPAFYEAGEDGLFFRLEGHRRDEQRRIPDEVLGKLGGGSLAQALDDDQWRAALVDLVRVRRAWTVVGLFWALLVDRLEAGRGFSECGRCGRPVPAPQRFCGPDSSRACYRARRADDQRRSHENRGPRSLSKGQVP